jgi:AraC-like DNA-binding protein
MLSAPVNLRSKWPADFGARVGRLFDLFDRPAAPCRTAMLRTELLTLLFDLLDLNVPDASPAYRGRVRKAIDWAEAQTAQPPTLEQLAGVAGLSMSSFKRIFKEVAGIPPHAYILRKRIDRAQELLRGGKGTVTEIAFACGFPSSQYFATAFKRVTGLTPNDVLRHRVTPLPRDEDGQ